MNYPGFYLATLLKQYGVYGVYRVNVFTPERFATYWLVVPEGTFK